MSPSIYDVEQRLTTASRRIEESENLSDHNKRLILRYRDDMLAKGTDQNRVAAYLYRWAMLEDHITFPLDDPDREQLKQLVIELNQNQLDGEEFTPESRKDYKQTLSTFYRLLDGVDRDQLLGWMTIHIKKSERRQLNLDTLPDREHVQALVQACKNPRDKALIALLYDSGGRIGEVLQISWGDLELQEGQITLDGKTGQRHVPLHESLDLLQDWHQFHDEPLSGAPVFGLLRDHTQQISYRGMRSRIEEAADRAELPDRIKTNPHAFRKARACDLARSDAMDAWDLRQFFGWDSVQTAQYYIDRATDETTDNFRRYVQGRTRISS